MRYVFTLFFLLWASYQAQAQLTVSVTIDSVEVNTVCPNIFLNFDPLARIWVEGEGELTYPSRGACFTELPNVQYTAQYDCPPDLPADLNVCFRVFGNTPILPLGCFTSESCAREICGDFPLPAINTSASYTLNVPGNNPSNGTVYFTITLEGLGDYNDLPCQAISLGTLLRGDTLGDATIGQYDNLCGTNANEPNPADDGAFGNSNGVWFEFVTASDIGSVMWIEVLADPENTGDNFDAQVAIYQSDNDTCTGNLQLVGWGAPFNTEDLYLRFRCPEPDTRYYLLVDGAFSSPGSEQGPFGLRLISTDVDDAPNLRCDALPLGEVPLGGSIAAGPFGNYCASSINDPFNPAFVVQTSVWFSFEAPPTGHVLIDGIADQEVEGLGIQLGLYRPFSTCSGFFQHIQSSYTLGDLSESMQVSCLFPGETYYLMIDGDGGNGRGIFSLEITDAGDITPRTAIDTVLCAGESLAVGGSVYTEAGVYADTLTLFRGCDSIVNSTISVLDPIVVSVTQLRPAIGEGSANGQAEVSATGGTGNYTIDWCDGSSDSLNEGLIGGTLCCVRIFDDFGCVGDTCFTVDFVTEIVPQAESSPAACQGEASGSITFSVTGGRAPYSYEWSNADATLNGAGSITAEGEAVVLPDLLAGPYSIRVNDEFFDTTFIVTVTEPTALSLSQTVGTAASCFGFCDGGLEVVPSGGTPPYTLLWSTGGQSEVLDSLCAGNYGLTVVDANGCVLEAEYEVGQPAEFIGEIEISQEVSCFGGSDGRLAAASNGTPAAYEWSTGSTGSFIFNLPAGPYSLTITNTLGCQDTVQAFLPEPEGPVEASIALERPVSCNGDSDGALLAQAAGPGQSFSYQWSNGAQEQTANALPTGNYQLTVTNELGCADTASFFLPQPEALSLALSASDLTCPGGDNSGSIQVESVMGGTPPYTYSIDGVLFGAVPNFGSLFADTYTVVVRDAFDCEVESAQAVAPAPVLLASAGSDERINLGDSLSLQAQANSSDVIFTWTAQDGSGQRISGPAVLVSPSITTVYQLEVLDTVSLCTATDLVTVRVEKVRQVYIPNAFSPNGDGRNDEFFVHGGRGVAMVRSLRVFSRTGNLVFEAENIMPNDNAQGWDGRFRGERLNPGVFAYQAEIEFTDGRVEGYTGDVTLVK